MRSKWLWAVIVSGLLGLALQADAQPDPASQPAKAAEAGPSAIEPLAKAQEEELLAFLKKMGSAQYDRLLQVRVVNPQTYQTNVRSWYYWMLSLKRYPEAIQRAYVVQQEAYTQIYRLVSDLKIATDDTQKGALRDQLRTAVRSLFDAQMTAREFKLAQLEQQLQQLKAEISEARNNRDQKIDEAFRKWETVATQPAAAPTGGPLPPATTQPGQ